MLSSRKGSQYRIEFYTEFFFSYSDLMKQAPHESDTDSIQDYVDGENAGMCYVPHKKKPVTFF